MNIVENYPPQVLRLLMNHIGTHDTERAITVLAGEPMGNHGRDWQSSTHLSRERRQKGLRLMRLAALMQYTLPGVPLSITGTRRAWKGTATRLTAAATPGATRTKGWLNGTAALQDSANPARA